MCPWEGCWVGEGGEHDCRKESSWEAFEFNLLRGGDEADRGSEGGVEEDAYMVVEVGWYFVVEGVVVEYAEGARGCVGIVGRDPNR